MLINYEDIDESIKLIEETQNYYIRNKGNVYAKYSENKYHLIKGYLNKNSGYVYHTLMVNNKHKSFRTNRLVAKAFVPNPDNLPIVGHKNNIKSDNCYKNLYWTTNSENVQKAVNDGLLVNDKGVNDSQSIQIVCFDKNGKFLKEYGSITIAHKELRISKSTISRQIKHEHKSQRCGYYFRLKSEYDKYGFVL